MASLHARTFRRVDYYCLVWPFLWVIIFTIVWTSGDLSVAPEPLFHDVFKCCPLIVPGPDKRITPTGMQSCQRAQSKAQTVRYVRMLPCTKSQKFVHWSSSFKLQAQAPISKLAHKCSKAVRLPQWYRWFRMAHSSLIRACRSVPIVSWEPNDNLHSCKRRHYDRRRYCETWILLILHLKLSDPLPSPITFMPLLSTCHLDCFHRGEALNDLDLFKWISIEIVVDIYLAYRFDITTFVFISAF